MIPGLIILGVIVFLSIYKGTITKPDTDSVIGVKAGFVPPVKEAFLQKIDTAVSTPVSKPAPVTAKVTSTVIKPATKVTPVSIFTAAGEPPSIPYSGGKTLKRIVAIK